jgi:hypothetical protein
MRQHGPVSRLSLVLASSLIALLAPTGDAAAAHELVESQVCLAESWGTSSRREWRVQFGVFDDPVRAQALERELQARGLAAETYLAAWLAGDEREPRSVVSAAYRSRVFAERAARRHRGSHGDAMVRQFIVWSRRQ